MKVFVQGSYRNRVNVRQDSDVDVGVLCHDVFRPEVPLGRTWADFGIARAAYRFSEFKADVENALVAHFGRAAVTRGNKAFDVKATSRQVEADVVPLLEFRSYFDQGGYLAGVALDPDDGSPRIVNFPERLLDHWPAVPLHYENGVSKNADTGRRFKGVVRILKSICNEMVEAGQPAAEPIPGYLLECLAWNAPNVCYRGINWGSSVRAVLLHLWSATGDDAACRSMREVDNIKSLFDPSQPWTRTQAHAFIGAAWHYLGLR